MLYSSGTTGRPKGVKWPLPDMPAGGRTMLVNLLAPLFGYGRDARYLSPAPLYHAAPLRHCMTVIKLGGTVFVMERFDAERSLQCIAQHRITHSQWVPTMLVRMLKLPQDVRTRHDLSSLQVAVHAAAPCPVDVKQRMLDWWGPIVHEYYAGTELNGGVAVLLLRAHRDDLDGVELQHGDRDVASVLGEQAGHAHLLCDHTRTHGLFLPRVRLRA